MFRPLARSTRRPHRRGTSFVLIVVVMISFAAAVGVAFALFAGQALRQAQAHKDAQGGGGVPQARAPEPTYTLNRFLGSFIFGVGGDSDEDVTNALRGHELSRSMYGGDVTQLPSASNPSALGITTPWNGVGLAAASTGFVNYTQIPGPLLYDPEYAGTRTFTGATRTQLLADVTSGTAPRAYTSKAAGYSYPDLKDFFAAAVDSATGQVMTPSFHRPWLWNRTVGTTTTTLGPDNPNWTDPAATTRLKTLRPRPLEHPKFPRVPQNADGTYTGDVQNWPGGYTYDPVTQKFFARNDSLWMHIGLPPVPFGNRKVQPLVAPLIVPLDGLLNAGAHGNNYGPPVAAGGVGTHQSYAGYHAGEVNIGRATGADPSSLPNDRAAVVNMHANPQQRFGLSAQTNDKAAYDPYRLVPQVAPASPTMRPLHAYAPVPWGNTAVAQPAYPTGTNLTGVPNFGAGFASTNARADNHPVLHSAGQWSQYSPRQSPLSDVKRLHLRYAFTPDWYAASELGRAADRDLGQGTETFSYVTQRDTLNRYRLDNAHTLRKLITPYAFGLDRPKLAPNFAGGGGLTMNGIKPGAIAPAGTSPAPGGGGGVFSDIPAGNALMNQWTALGSVDVNRPLADYRDNQTAPLGIGNVSVTPGSAGHTANSDRRKLAQDIFVRLAVATGAALQPKVVGVQYPMYPYAVQPLAGGVGPGSGQFDALRYLAQLAVNIVDFRDEDDISTAFVWNPLPQGMGDPVDPHLDPRNFAAGEVGNRVVFGVEKSRAVLNEVYSEITNDRTTEANGADNDNNGTPDVRVPDNGVAWVKFWAELVNPMTPSNSNIVPNAAPLRGYRIEIARGTTKTGNSAAIATLFDPSNTTGSFSAPADAAFDLHGATNGPAAPTTISANNGTYTAAALPGAGFVLVGPPARVPPKPAPSEEFNPLAAGKWADGNVVRSPDPGPPGATSNAMAYSVPLTTTDAMMNTIPIEPGSREFRRHVVLLRRKANPYVIDDPMNAVVGQLNPHITVDVMDCVPSFDALHRLAGQAASRVPRDGTNPIGYDPRPERFSVGKVQPFAGYAELPTTAPPVPEPGQHPRSAQPGAPNYNTYTFPESMVLAQRPVPPVAGEPQNTFGQHNGQSGTGPTETAAGAGSGTLTESNPGGTPAVPKATLSDTLMAPFDWLVHLDRTVVNSAELFQVRDSAPHLVTQRFVRHLTTNAAPGLTYEGGYARWQFTNDGLGRALELLSVKPFTTSVAHGGRIAGQLNVNAIRDKRVLNALFDPQNGNKFNDAFVDGVWNNWVSTRTPAAVVNLPNSTQTLRVSGPSGQSVQDGGAVGTADAPFQAGAAMVASGHAFTAGANENLSVLRRGGGARPVLFNQQPRGQEYFESEPLRKITNNITTVSHTYAVFLTIGYFEIDFETQNPASTPPNQRDGLLNLGGNTNMTRLAHEAYLNVPGDLRQKFVAVVDMSMMAMPALTTEPKTRPYFTTLEETARPSGTGSDTLKVAAASDGTAGVDSDGVAVRIQGGDDLLLGYGAEQQPLRVTAVTPDPNGGPLNVTVTGLTRTAWAGASVSNARTGYPGPQPSFDYTADRFKPVVPYVGRIK